MSKCQNSSVIRELLRNNSIKKLGTSLVVQWLRLCTPNTGGLGLISGQETRSGMPQLRPSAAK